MVRFCSLSRASSAVVPVNGRRVIAGSSLDAGGPLSAGGASAGVASTRSSRCALAAWYQRGTSESTAAFARTFVASKKSSFPDQSGLLAQLDHVREEPLEDREPQALPDTREAGVVRQRLVQVIAQVPAHAQPVGDHAHQVPL